MLTLSNLNKNVVIIYMSVFDLCMHDLYNVIEYIVKLYNELVFRLFGQMLPLRLLSVTQANTDITSIYSDTKQWKAFCEKNEEALVTVTWSFDSRKYKYAFLACKPIHFPPYTLEELRNNKPDNKIIALSTDNKRGAGCAWWLRWRRVTWRARRACRLEWGTRGRLWRRGWRRRAFEALRTSSSPPRTAPVNPSPSRV